MRATIAQVAALALAAVSLAACGGGGRNDDARRAVEQVNGGTAPFFVREFVDESGPVASCYIAPRPEREGEMLLVVTTKSSYWLQGTIDLDTPLLGQDITTGRNLDAETLSMLESDGDPCTVSAEDGTVALA
ncbi:MAG: hypothetical protein ACJ74P_01625 [Gaiellaceae bacterium]